MDAASFQLVRQAPLFANLSDAELDCISGGEIIDLAPGQVLAKEGESADSFFVILSGEVQFWRSFDRQDVLMAVGKAGHFSGEMPLLLGVPWMSSARGFKQARLFRLNPDAFWRMLGCSPSITREVISTAAARFRNIEGYASQREKLMSLGTMAAGLAHELNNPASAALRAASYLQKATDDVQSLMCALTHGLAKENWAPLLAASADAVEILKKAQPLDSIARSDRESVVGEWLEQLQVPEAWEAAGTFVESGIEIPWLEALLQKLPAAGQAPAVQWIEARLRLKILLKQVETSTSRVSELVKAVKSYTHIDKSVKTEIDIHEGIETTLVMLGHKLKGVNLRRDFDKTLPRVMAYAGELNQVWTNLIDNAIDAVGGTGKICIATSQEGDQALVEIVDDGTGIPANVQAHMFEPFFTTKPVGSGTGLGLVISNRIVADRHGGEIEFESKPGETRFKVRVPFHERVALSTGK